MKNLSKTRLRRYGSALLAGLFALPTGHSVGGAAAHGADKSAAFPIPQVADRPRLLVMTDIGGDPDDQQSFIRLLVSNNLFEIEGLIATATKWRASRPESVNPQIMTEAIAAYGKVQPNLARHADGFATADELLAKVRAGAPTRGRPTAGPAERNRPAFGADLDTEASKLIVSAVDRDDTRPLNIIMWGGQVDLAQALWRVREDRGPQGIAAFVKRFRVYDVSNQALLAEQLWQDFPGMTYILSEVPEGSERRAAPHNGMYSGGDESLTSQAWINQHVRSDHGPLGALYPGKTNTFANKNNALKEGDTPSLLYFMSNGLSDPAHPEWGSWGGRFTLNPAASGAAGHVYRDAFDKVAMADPHHEEGAKSTVYRWREAFQADFQARMDWCVKSPAEANHAPKAVVNGDSTLRVIQTSAKPGETAKISAAESIDPDGDEWTAGWSFYEEAGDVPILPALSTDPDSKSVSLVVPDAPNGASMHLLLQVRDKGEPALTGYRRIVIAIR